MSETWTILKVLDSTREWFAKRGLDNPRLDAEVLISHALGLQRVMLYAHFDRPLGEDELSRIRELVRRRGQHEPVAYITGSREFWSLDLEVGPSVLVPRPDTETLIEAVLDKCDKDAIERVADVGTGSGCIAIALASELSNAKVEAFDVSPEACEVARRNVEKHGLADRVTVTESDLLTRTDGARFDLIAANLPYITSEEMTTLPADVRDHEPHLALEGGADGLDVIRRLVEDAPKRMNAGAWIALEAGYEQLEAVERLLSASGFENARVVQDHGQLDRVAIARWPG